MKRAILAYEQMKKRIMDEIAAFAQKFDEGLKVGHEKGRQEGIQIGHEKGKIEGKIEVAKNLLKAGISTDVIPSPVSNKTNEKELFLPITGELSKFITCSICLPNNEYWYYFPDNWPF